MACRRPASRDGGSMHVLEAVILSLVLLGAAYSVTALRGGAGSAEDPRQKLELLAQDALIVLDGLREERGALLDLYLAEAFHCAAGSAASASDCDGTRSANLSLKLENYLPAGVAYGYGVGNGAGERILYRSVLPEGETVTSSRSIVPDWNLTFVAPEATCYEAGTDVTLLALPVWHARLANPVQLNVTTAGVNATAAKGADAVWRATLSAATRPPVGVVVADVNATDGTYPGATQYAFCNLGGDGPAILDALRAGSFAPTSRAAPLGSTLTLQYDLSALAALDRVALVAVNATVYEPLPPSGGAADRYAPAGVVALGTAPSGEGTWAVPAHSLYGVHPVLLKATVLTAGGTTVVLHRLDYVEVALATGEVPIDPPYRVFLQAWFPDWR